MCVCVCVCEREREREREREDGDGTRGDHVALTSKMADVNMSGHV